MVQQKLVSTRSVCAGSWFLTGILCNYRVRPFRLIWLDDGLAFEREYVVEGNLARMTIAL
jgi:hypothetical protein